MTLLAEKTFFVKFFPLVQRLFPEILSKILPFIHPSDMNKLKNTAHGGKTLYFVYIFALAQG